MKKPIIKLHRHLLDQLALGLVDVFAHQQLAEKVVERNLKSQRKWGARDRRFYAENIYGCVRWWRKLWYCLDLPEPKSTTNTEALQAWASFWILNGNEIPPDLEISGITSEKILRRAKELLNDSNKLALAESIPDWMNEWGFRERGDRWSSILKSLNEPAPVDLRVNTLKISREKLQDKLRQEEIFTDIIPSCSTGLSLQSRKNVFTSECFRLGYFEVQDRGSQQIAPLLPLQSGAKVIDACAGGGGKTLHLANLMQNKGQIIAMDVHDWKLKELQKRAVRNGIEGIETRLIVGNETIESLKEFADAVLLDVPCSGSGVLRRHPDSKWKLKMTEIESLRETQAMILKNYSSMVKAGGYLLYATCSIMNSENQQQVENFLRSPEAMAQGWKLLRDLQIDPDQNLGDGFFAALLQRS